MFFIYLCIVFLYQTDYISLIRPRSLVNRASDSGSEGRAFESHRGHCLEESLMPWRCVKV